MVGNLFIIHLFILYEYKKTTYLFKEKSFFKIAKIDFNSTFVFYDYLKANHNSFLKDKDNEKKK